ncbi:VOC family protein [Microbacterium sp. P05]|uniref:VOC family protein n=1 Tax=Microbacterium sp. P05 TaxID=3366948 RepID=UPI003745102F
MSEIDMGRMRQIAFVVPDLDEATVGWHRSTNAGPFYIDRHVRPNITYRGTLGAPLEYSAAFAGLGDVMLELIEQHSDEPSVYRDTFAPGTGGVHHLGYIVPTLDGAIEHFRSAGVEPAMIVHDSDPLIYFDTRSTTGGLMTELLVSGNERGDLFERVIASGRNWNGEHPIRDAASA